MSQTEIASHQRARLEGAMVEAVARHGFAGTTLRELVALAGVSRSTFYEHFANKQECFLATFDAIIHEASRQAGVGYRGPGDFRERMVAGLGRFMELVVEEPAAASLTTVESLTLGSAGVAHREQASRTFEVIVRESFRASPAEHELSDLTVRAIVNGINGVLYRRLRTARQGELPELVEPLIDWALAYRRADPPAVAEAVAAAAEPTPAEVRPAGEPGKPDWEEPPDSALSKRTLTQRERIVRAAARVVVERGYEALSIPAISAAAGTSNQTFYENFDTKRDAFLGAFDIIAADAFGYSFRAFKAAGDSPAAIGAGLRALIEHIAAHRMFARLAFFELPAAGPPAFDRADAAMDSITAFLEPPLAPTGSGKPVPGAIREAIGTGIWAVIQHEIANDRGGSLPELAPEITRIALMPLQ